MELYLNLLRNCLFDNKDGKYLMNVKSYVETIINSKIGGSFVISCYKTAIFIAGILKVKNINRKIFVISENSSSEITIFRKYDLLNENIIFAQDLADISHKISILYMDSVSPKILERISQGGFVITNNLETTSDFVKIEQMSNGEIKSVWKKQILNYVSLQELVDNRRTDKNTVHSYIDVYETLFKDRKISTKNLLEIGIDVGGGSIKLWNEYFINAKIYALDIINIDKVWNGIKKDGILLYTSSDAYDKSLFHERFHDKLGTFDIVIDDGPHTLESMKIFIELYLDLLNDKGILIIEDVQDISWIHSLRDYVPENLKRYIEVYDLRHIKNRYDDIIFAVNKDQ